MNGHLGHLHVSLLWIILLSAWMYKDFFAVPLSIILGIHPEAEFLDHMVILFLFLFFEEHIILLSSVYIPFYIPNNAYVFQFVHLIAHTSIFCFFFFFFFLAHSSPNYMMSYLTIVLLCISLMNSDVRHLFMCTLAICITSLKKKVYWNPLPIFELMFAWVFSLLSFRSHLYILDTNPLTDTLLANIFFHSMVYFLFCC